jgi:hypothetical protein
MRCIGRVAPRAGEYDSLRRHDCRCINATNAHHRVVGAILVIAHDAMHWTHCPQRGDLVPMPATPTIENEFYQKV